MYKVRVNEDDPVHDVLEQPWIAMRAVFWASQCHVPQMIVLLQWLHRTKFSVRGLATRAATSSSIDSGRSADPHGTHMGYESSSWEYHHGETMGTHTNSRGISAQSLQSSIGGVGGGVPQHDCVWGRVQQPGPITVVAGYLIY